MHLILPYAGVTCCEEYLTTQLGFGLDKAAAKAAGPASLASMQGLYLVVGID